VGFLARDVNHPKERKPDGPVRSDLVLGRHPVFAVNANLEHVSWTEARFVGQVDRWRRPSDWLVRAGEARQRADQRENPPIENFFSSRAHADTQRLRHNVAASSVRVPRRTPESW